MDNNGADVTGGEEARQAFDLDVAESVGGVPRLEDVTGPAGGNDLVNLACRQEVAGGEIEGPEVFGADHALAVEGFPMRQNQAGVPGAKGGQPHPAVEVLAEVDDGGTRLRRGNRHSSKRLDPAHRRCGHRN